MNGRLCHTRITVILIDIKKFIMSDNLMNEIKIFLTEEFNEDFNYPSINTNRSNDYSQILNRIKSISKVMAFELPVFLKFTNDLSDDYKSLINNRYKFIKILGTSTFSELVIVKLLVS